jgi:5-methylcytosine-specific restriction endonuclease McrA
MSRDFMYLNETPRDGEYVKAYLKEGSTIKAAQVCGVSRETIARACRRNNIVLDGRKRDFASKSGKRPCKITDAQLIEESKALNCRSIATKYGMSEERVFRRARKLGIELETQWTGGHYKRRSQRYGATAFDETITLKEVRKRFNDICQICGMAVNPYDIANGHARRMYPTVDHIIPLSKGGTHTWDNVQLAHMCCNSGKCDRVKNHA